MAWNLWIIGTCKEHPPFYLGHKRVTHSLMVECYVACANELQKPFESQDLSFLTRDLDPTICHETTKSTNVFSLFFPHESRGNVLAPVAISTAEARQCAGGARRLRGGRAAAAPSPGGRRAPAGPRAPRDARLRAQLGVRAAAPGAVPRGARAAPCCGQSRSRCVLLLGTVGKHFRET